MHALFCLAADTTARRADSASAHLSYAVGVSRATYHGVAGLTALSGPSAPPLPSPQGPDANPLAAPSQGSRGRHGSPMSCRAAAASRDDARRSIVLQVERLPKSPLQHGRTLPPRPRPLIRIKDPVQLHAGEHFEARGVRPLSADSRSVRGWRFYGQRPQSGDIDTPVCLRVHWIRVARVCVVTRWDSFVRCQCCCFASLNRRDGLRTLARARATRAIWTSQQRTVSCASTCCLEVSSRRCASSTTRGQQTRVGVSRCGDRGEQSSRSCALTCFLNC